MTAPPTSGMVGQPLTYTMSATNNGALAASGTTLNFQTSTVIFTDTRFAAASSSQGGCAALDSLTLSCALNTLTPSSVATVTVVITPTVLFPATISNTVAVSSAVPPPELNPADNQATQTTAIALPQTSVDVGTIWKNGVPWPVCRLTEYYDTASHFRIYYTRSTPNVPLDPVEADCRIKDPQTLAANGYPQFVEELGTSLETSFATYARMGYDAAIARVPKNSSGRYPVYISTGPIWTNELFFPADAAGITFPGNMYIPRTAQYAPNQPIDQLRAEIGAHESFHTLQWTYVSGAGLTWLLSEDVRWWMEATAQWAQHEVYPNDISYAGVIPDYLNEPWRSMVTRPPQGGTNIPYSPLFPLYLIEKQPGGNNKDIVKSTWEQYANNGGTMMRAIDDVLPTGGIQKIFPNYAEANYFLAYTVVDGNGGTIDIRDAIRANDPKRYPVDIRPLADRSPLLSEQSQLFIGPDPSYGGRSGIEPLGSAYVEFGNGFTQKGQGRSLRISMTITDTNLSVEPVVKVWRIDTYPIPAANAPIVAPLLLPKQGNKWVGTTTIQNFDDNQLHWIVIEIANPQTSGSSITSWDYRAEIIAPTPTPTLTATPTSTSTPVATPTLAP